MFDVTATIGDFLNAAASRKPTPGGGSVTALVGALAVSMGEMVVNYSIGPKSLEPYLDQLKPALAELTRAREVLVQLMVEDQLAYEALTAARKLPPDAPDREGTFNAALLTCIRVPESVAATGTRVLEICDQLVNFVNRHLLSDLAVCADLSMACIRCAVYNVRINMADLKDPADRQAIESNIGRILTRAVAQIQNVAPRIWDRSAREAKP